MFYRKLNRDYYGQRPTSECICSFEALPNLGYSTLADRDLADEAKTSTVIARQPASEYRVMSYHSLLIEEKHAGRSMPGKPSFASTRFSALLSANRTRRGVR